MASRIQELEELAAAQVSTGQSDPTAAVTDGPANDEALKTLQAEYDAYKVAQNERFTSSVSRVNAANVSRPFVAPVTIGANAPCRKNFSVTLEN
jgi:hypothetical protein